MSVFDELADLVTRYMIEGREVHVFRDGKWYPASAGEGEPLEDAVQYHIDVINGDRPSPASWTMSFDSWLMALARLLGEKPNEEDWKPYYDEGYSPRDAVGADNQNRMD